MMDLMQNIQEKVHLLDKAVTQFGKRGQAYAEAHRKYRIQYAAEILKLKQEGLPATLIKEVAKGNIADVGFELDAADAVYQSAKEAINAYKLQIKVLEEQIQREWHSQ